MTIGSPIEIHHLLWPGLWHGQRPVLTPSLQLSEQCVIRWHNYIDDGDPIAYELKETRKWLNRVTSIADRAPGCIAMTDTRSESSALALLMLAGVVAALSGIVVRRNPRQADLILVLAGLISTAGLIVRIVYLRGEEPRAEIWPVVLAAIAFFYLWWLTAMLFDLTFVWQRYVRESAASDHLARLATK